jgi:GH24 family phage-related lysozyme (muramidase)
MKMFYSNSTVDKKIFEEKLYEHMKLREGYKNEVYLDTLDKPTCGIGHLLTASEREDFPVGTEVDDYKIKEWYMEDITKALEAARDQAKLLSTSDDSFIIALTSVNYQLGTSWNRKFPTAWKCLCHKEYDKAIDEIVYADKKEVRYSRWYKQTPVRVEDFVKAINKLKEIHNG